MIAILILAAGASSRMRGRDKLMEEVDGQPLLRRQVLRARATGAPVVLTLPPLPHPRYGAIAELDVQCVPVPDAATGMSASLRAGLAALPPETQAVMVLLADMPDITTNDMNTVLQAVDLNSDKLIWRAVTPDGKAGHPVIFHRRLLPELTALQGDQGGGSVVKSHVASMLPVPLPDARARTDLDTPEDWVAWRAARASI